MENSGDRDAQCGSDLEYCKGWPRIEHSRYCYCSTNSHKSYRPLTVLSATKIDIKVAEYIHIISLYTGKKLCASFVK
uniref:Uncharacterized protein n=1 Tax=Arion vulgaris TaxID=1028688 RepID=A0A0B6ZMH7_9EUPU